MQGCAIEHIGRSERGNIVGVAWFFQHLLLAIFSLAFGRFDTSFERMEGTNLQ